MTDEQLLESFGRLLVSEVRDEAIEKFEMIVSGKMKSAPALELNNKLSNFNQDQLSLIRGVVVSSIDDVLHNLLWMFEQQDDLDLIFGVDEDSPKINICDASDGLSGKLYTEDGWIEKFSKYKETL